MFANEIKVNGEYVTGTIRITDGVDYVFIGGMEFPTNEWSANMLFDLAHELKEVQKKIDSLNE